MSCQYYREGLRFTLCSYLSQVKLDDNKMNKQKKKKNMQYTKEDINQAIDSAKNGKTISLMAIQQKVPASTIRAKINGLYSLNKKPGRCSVLSSYEKRQLVRWIIESSNRGFPINKNQLIDSVKNICISLNRNNDFVDNRPGNKFFKRFLKDHPEISKRVPEKET